MIGTTRIRISTLLMDFSFRFRTIAMDVNSEPPETRFRWTRAGDGFNPGSAQSFLAVDPNVVHQHSLGKNRRSVRVTRPAASDCDIQQNKEGVIKNPSLSGWKVSRCSSLIQVSIHIESNCGSLPLDGKNVEVIRKLTGRQALRARQSLVSRVARPMHAAVDDSRLFANI